jgi:glycosyltransferase involved in cell wall biosynthesis
MLKKLLQLKKEYGLVYANKMIYNRYQIKYKVGRQYFPVRISKEERTSQSAWIPQTKTKISIVVPLYNTPESFLNDMIRSVCQQTYADWELCLADASEAEYQEKNEKIIQQYQEKDDRIHYRKLASNDGISNNTNHAILMTQGDYIALLDHDDILHPSALYFVMQEIDQQEADFIYTDELSFEKSTEHVQSIHFKPDFSQENLYCNNYICHFTVFSKSLLTKSGMFRKKFDGSQDYDLFLRLTSSANRICHVPRVLYYWRCHPDSMASGAQSKPYAIENGRQALAEHLKKRGIPAIVKASKKHPSFYHVIYSVPDHCRVLLLAENEQVEKWLWQQKKYMPYDITLCNTLENQQTFASRYDDIFLLRDAYRPEGNPGVWLNELLQCLQPPENLVAGTLVYDENEKVVHAGYCYDTAFSEKIRPLYEKSPRNDPGYMNRLAFRQNVSLLGGACLAMKSSLFDAMILKTGSSFTYSSLFSLPMWFSFCLMSQKNWGNCVITPFAVFDTIPENTENEFPPKEESPEWQNFWKMGKDILLAPDAHYNPGMRVFGTYYLNWKKGR